MNEDESIKQKVKNSEPFMSGCVRNCQKRQKISGESDDCVDDAPNSGDLPESRVDGRIAFFARMFGRQTVDAQVVHVLNPARLVRQHFGYFSQQQN